MVQQLRPCVSTARGMGLIPGWGTEIPHAVPGVAKKKNQNQKNSSVNVTDFFFKEILLNEESKVQKSTCRMLLFHVRK